MGEIRIVTRANLSASASTMTGGMHRLEGLAAAGVHVVEVRTEPGLVSGWHHHGDNGTYGYVIGGRLRLEWGTAGQQFAEAGPGEFFYVAPNTVHRESNPVADEQFLVGFRVGTGPTVFNVEGPDAA
jgi:uncharacterized RmlC-like cupin family protein